MTSSRPSTRRDGGEDRRASAEHEENRLTGSGLVLDGLGDVAGLHLRMAQAAVNRQFLDRLAPLELTQKQTAVLWLIGANPGVSQIALATALGMDRATMMAIIDRLDTRGLLTRKRSTADARRTALELTPQGRKTLASAKTAVADHEHALRERLSKEEMAALVSCLKRLYFTD